MSVRVEKRGLDALGAVGQAQDEGRHVAALDNRHEDDPAPVHVEALLVDDALGHAEPVARGSEGTCARDGLAAVVAALDRKTSTITV